MSKHHDTFEEALVKAGFKTDGSDKMQTRLAGQRQLFEEYRAGKHIILKAPTGWGKTFAVIAALKDHTIYSLPLRVLVDSLAASATDYAAGKVVAHHGNNKNHAQLDPYPTGDASDQEISTVFTTLDQTLSAFLGIPIGVKYGQGNVLPAVVDASNLVFDEFHLFDSARSMATALFALERSRRNCIVLTATLSDVMIEHLREVMGRSPLPGFDADDAAAKVSVIRGERPYTNTKLIEKGNGLDGDLPELKGRLVIIMRNQTEWAKSTYLELRERYASEDVDLYLLHSEFLPEDRHRIETTITRRFGKEKAGRVDRRQILVSTQVIEAGVDITCDEMHTDLCPSSSFVQRIGRAARYPGEEATIYVHPVETNRPYSGQDENIEALQKKLATLYGQALTEAEEENLVQLSAEADRKFIAAYNKRSARAEVDRLRTLRAYEGYREMIRSIDSVAVAVADLQDDHKDKSFRFVGVSTSAFYNKDKYKEVILKAYRWNSDTKQFEAIDVSSERDYLRLADFILLDHRQVGYTPDRGLFLLNGESPTGKSHFITTADKGISFRYVYNLEPYQAHLKLLAHEKERFGWMLDFLAEELVAAELADTDTAREAAESLLDLVIWCHDLGKLAIGWQKGHGVEEMAGVPDEYSGLAHVNSLHLDLIPGPSPIAHSEPEPGSYYRREGQQLPSHAWISAWVAKDMIIEACDGYLPLALPLIWAVAEHHGYLKNRDGIINAKRFEPYELGFLDYLDRMSAAEPFARYGWSSDDLRNLNIDKAGSQRALAWFEANTLLPEHHVDVYYAMSYLLRKCDWGATSRVSNKIINDQ